MRDGKDNTERTRADLLGISFLIKDWAQRTKDENDGKDGKDGKDGNGPKGQRTAGTQEAGLWKELIPIGEALSFRPVLSVLSR